MSTRRERIAEIMGFDRAGEWTVPPERTWSGTVGLEIFLGEDGELRATLPVTDAVRQPLGLVHGGVYAAIGEELASMATARAVASEGKLALGMSNSTQFFRPVSEGHVHAVAAPVHQGRTTQVWSVEMSDDDGRRCAMSTVTIAVRERR
jgi:1,4-dihydroxy-2-naphthoyl-CoA hydrolase